MMETQTDTDVHTSFVAPRLTKRMTKMLQWIEKHPYQVYGVYDDTISDSDAQLILTGQFDEFWDSWSEVEFNASDYVDWSDWEQKFVEEFYGYHAEYSFSDLPQAIQDLCAENRIVDCSDLLSTCLGNWRGHVCARLVKRNGDYVEFPNFYNDNAQNRAFQDYLKRRCGIDGWKGEASYPGTYLTVLGRVDLEEILNKRQKPEYIWIDSDCFTIGHEPMNGSGTCGDDSYKGKRRKMKAEFFVDGTRGYGIDDIYGLTGKCWANDLEIAFA